MAPRPSSPFRRSATKLTQRSTAGYALVHEPIVLGIGETDLRMLGRMQKINAEPVASGRREGAAPGANRSRVA